MTDELHDAATRLFDEHSAWDAVGAAEADGWAGGLWAALRQTGFADVSVPEEFGGAGGDVADAVAILEAAGAHAAPVPLAEAGLIGGWLLVTAGLRLPAGVRTVLPPGATAGLRLDGDRLFGPVPAVPWGRHAEHVVALVDGVVVLAPGPAAQGGPDAIPAVNLADEPRDTVHFDGIRVTAQRDAPAPLTEERLWERCALGRVALMAGAVRAAAAMTLRYSREREQFGRPIGRFQAVQTHLVTLQQQDAVVRSALDGAVEAVQAGRGGFEIACAKTLADAAAQLVCAAAHQTHGAIGMTREYPLHYLTRRLQAWRDEAGGHHRWTDRIGAAVVAAGPDALYPAIQDGSEVLA